MDIVVRGQFNDIVSYLLHLGANPDGNTSHPPLHQACLFGDTVLAEILLTGPLFVVISNTPLAALDPY